MSILRMEGFAHFTTGADWVAKGHGASGVNLDFHPTAGRGGRGRAYIGLNAGLSCLLPVARQTIIHHIAFYVPTLTTVGLAEFRNVTHGQVAIYALPDGSFLVFKPSGLFGESGYSRIGNDSEELAISDPALWRGDTWHQAQIKTSIDGSGAGTMTMKLDGIQILDLSGLSFQTGGTGGNKVSSVLLPSERTGSTHVYASDLVICDDQGTKYNDFLGDVAVYESVEPVDGDLLEWTRNSGIGTWASHVNQNPKDDDDSYLRSDTGGNRVSFFFPTVASDIGTVLAIKETVAHRKEEPAYGVIKLFSRSDDDVNHDGPLKASTQTYKFDERIIEEDQKDGADWSVDRVNATQLGIMDAT